MPLEDSVKSGNVQRHTQEKDKKDVHLQGTKGIAHCFEIMLQERQYAVALYCKCAIWDVHF